MVLPVGGNTPLDRNLSELNDNVEKGKEVASKRNNPLSTNEDVQQTANTAASIYIGSGVGDTLAKQALTNLVMQNTSSYDQTRKVDADFVAQRNLGTIASESVTGTTVNPGTTPSEINSRPEV